MLKKKNQKSPRRETAWRREGIESRQVSGLWASLIAQLVKNPPAVLETPVQFLGQENPLEEE